MTSYSSVDAPAASASWPGADDVDHVAALGQAAGHQRGELRLVLHQQHPHTPMLGMQMSVG